MDRALKKRRRKWKIRNLGYVGWIKSLFRKKRYIYFDQDDIGDEEEVEIELIEDWKPFMLVKPSGYMKVDAIRKILKEHNVNIVKEYEIPDYNVALSALFTTVEMREKAYWRQINDKYYSTQGNSKAYILQFEDGCPVNLLEQIKIEIRRKCGIDFFYVLDKDREVYETSITPVHVPDEEDMKEEFSRVMHFVAS